MILTGHHCLVNGTVKLALGEYLRAAREIPSDPLIHLLIANAYLSHIMSRRCHDRHTTCIRAFTYLLCYAKYRNWTQEVSLHQANTSLSSRYSSLPRKNKVYPPPITTQISPSCQPPVSKQVYYNPKPQTLNHPANLLFPNRFTTTWAGDYTSYRSTLWRSRATSTCCRWGRPWAQL